MNGVSEKKIIKNSTTAIVVTSLAASLSVPIDCYGFEENNKRISSELYAKGLNPKYFDTESLERILQYTTDNYSEDNLVSINENYTEIDLGFVSLMNKFSEEQINADADIQEALNKFSKVLGSKKPRRNRF